MGYCQSLSRSINVNGQILSNIGVINFINKYFTDIATDAAYDRLKVTKYLFNNLALNSAKVKCMEDFEVQRTLAGVCKPSKFSVHWLGCVRLRSAAYIGWGV